jgi:hypothetical protein
MKNKQTCYNEHSVKTNTVIMNKFLGKIGHFSTHMNPVITNKNGRSLAVRYNLTVSLC